MTEDLINQINERMEILNLFNNPGYNPMIFNYPYESAVNLNGGKNQKPIFDKINFYDKINNLIPKKE